MELLYVQKMYSDMKSAERLRTKTKEREDEQMTSRRRARGADNS